MGSRFKTYPADLDTPRIIAISLVKLRAYHLNFSYLFFPMLVFNGHLSYTDFAPWNILHLCGKGGGIGEQR